MKNLLKKYKLLSKSKFLLSKTFKRLKAKQKKKIVNITEN